MNLANYFLADLPPEATLTTAMLSEACQTLRRNREQYLAGRSTESLIHTLSQLARHWLDPEYSFRKLALEHGPAATRFGPVTLASGLDSFFRQLTPENFFTLLEQDLGHRKRLDEMTVAATEHKSNRAAMALGPEFLVHVTAGNLPNPTWLSMVFGLLLRSAQFVKCASGTSLLPRLFAHSLYEVEPKLAACLEIAEWRGGNVDLENVLFEHANCVTATGSDETIAQIRLRAGPRARFVAYGHRVSMAYVANGVLTGLNTTKVVARAATDVMAWNQLGCLSPHVIYVEEGGMTSPDKFAELLAEELSRREETDPRGELPVEIAGAIASRRNMYELRAAHARANTAVDYPDTRLWCSDNSTSWTVVYEADPRFQTSCLNRFIYVKPATDLTAALNSADAIKGKLSTVALAAPEDKAQQFATELACWGVSRVCPLGRMQEPPLMWRHDGRPALGDLVTWTDWEP
jgi:hypothetical protein